MLLNEGPTGCGKTSLLNCLAARVTSSSSNKNTKLTGSIYVNGVIRNDESFRKISAYVLQDDKLYPHLTVFETLLLSAHFFLGDDVSFETKTDLVNSVITELGLNKVTNTLIGDEKVRGVSGGKICIVLAYILVYIKLISILISVSDVQVNASVLILRFN